MGLAKAPLTIIKAGLLVFSKLGKKKASMAAIANEANVSKPLLFHHFGNKEKLYKACSDLAKHELDRLRNEAPKNGSFFNILKQLQVKKFNLESQYPGIFKFYMLETRYQPVMPENPWQDLAHREFHPRVNANQLWHLLYYLSLGYQHASETEADLQSLIQDFQASFTLLESLVLKKED